MSNSGNFKTSAYDGRYLLFSWRIKSQSIANNRTTIEWTLQGAGTASAGYYKAGNFKVVIDGNTVYSSSTRINLYNGTVVATGTYTLTHDSAGARSFTASAQAGIYTTAVNCTGSGSFTLDSIPRASAISSVSGNKVTDTFAVKFTKYVSSYTDTLNIGVEGKAASQKISGYTSGKTFTLSDAIKSAIYAASQASQSASVSFWLTTYSGSSKVGDSERITKSVTINDSQPSIGDITYRDTNSKTVAITGDSSKIIRNNSTLSVTISDIKAFNGASLSSLHITLGDIDQTISISGSTISAKTVDLGTVNLSSDSVLKVTATDSRGHTATASISVAIYDYEKPTANISCQRRNNFYSETDINVTPIYSSLGGKNSVTITAKYKEADATSYTGSATLTAGTKATLNLDNAKAWNVRVSVKDKIGTTNYTLFVEKGQPIIFFDRLKSSVGVNCFPRDENSLEVLGKNIYNALFYSPGDSVTVKNIYACGTVTSGNTALDFSIPLPKSLENVSSIAISELKISARHAGGGYTLSDSYVSGGYDVLADSNITVTYSIKTGTNAIAIYLDTKSKYNGANNTPQSIQIHSLKFTCN